MCGLPATLKCPSTRGEEWPSSSYKSFVDIKAKVQSEDSIIFYCPANHKFTLRKAMKKKMFTPEQASKIVAEAQRVLDEFKAKGNGG